jgi:hypothetical protein
MIGKKQHLTKAGSERFRAAGGLWCEAHVRLETTFGHERAELHALASNELA